MFNRKKIEDLEDKVKSQQYQLKQLASIRVAQEKSLISKDKYIQNVKIMGGIKKLTLADIKPGNMFVTINDDILVRHLNKNFDGYYLVDTDITHSINMGTVKTKQEVLQYMKYKNYYRCIV